jgi:formate transporter
MNKLIPHCRMVLSGILAGLFIGLGGSFFLLSLATISSTAGAKIIGSFLFSAGLLFVCLTGSNLYTGKIGYLPDKGYKYLVSLGEMLLGNFIGAVLLGELLSLTPVGKTLMDALSSCLSTKFINIGTSDGVSWYVGLINSFFCGLLVYLAVDLFKKAPAPIFKCLGLIFSVALFVGLGFEHCVADMFYFALSGAFWNANAGRAFLSIFIYIIGNSLGSLFLHYALSFHLPPIQEEIAK